MSEELSQRNVLSDTENKRRQYLTIRKDFLEEMAFKQGISILLAGEKKDTLSKQKRIKHVCIVRNTRLLLYRFYEGEGKQLRCEAGKIGSSS